MRKYLTVLTGIALISISTLTGCSQTHQNVVVAPNMPANKITTPTNQTTGSNTTQPNVNPGGVSVGTPAPAELPKQSTGPITAVSFATDKIGFIASVKGIYRTMDGGQTWAKVYNATEPIIGLQATQATLQGQPYIYAVAWTKDGMFDTLTGDAFSRVHFDGSTAEGLGTAPIEGVQILPNDATGGDFLVFVSNGAVWSSNPSQNGGMWVKSTPPVPVASVTAVDASTWYAATTSGVLYKTTDFGQHWNKVFSAPIKTGEQPWKIEMQAKGNHVAVLFYGGAAGMSKEAYILFDSNDAGTTWNAIVDEAYYSTLYSGAKILDQTDIGEYPGPFAMDANGNLFITGFSMDGQITVLTAISPDGQTIAHGPVGPSANSPNVFDMLPGGVATPDGTHIVVVGGKNGNGVIEKSDDGGFAFQPE